MKSCSKCNQQKSLDQFRLRNKSKGPEAGYHSYCIECKKEDDRAYNRTHKERRAQAVQEFYLRLPHKYMEYKRNRKALIKGAEGTHTFEDVLRILQEQDQKCYYCFEPLVEYHVEHKTPLTRNGSNWPENLCCSCPKCNLEKHTDTVEEYMTRKGTIALAMA